MSFESALIGAIREVVPTVDGVYRIADTSLTFVESPELVAVKNLIKAYQFFPDTRAAILEYHKYGKFQRPFFTAAVFVRNIIVELEVASYAGLMPYSSTEDGEEYHRLISDVASAMHILCMGFVLYQAQHALDCRSLLAKAQKKNRVSLYKKQVSRVKKLNAITKISQQAFLISHINQQNIYRLLTLIFNICAIYSCILSSNSMKNYYI
jgi:hypothetical protein